MKLDNVGEQEKGVAKEARAVSTLGVMLPDNKAVKKSAWTSR